MINVTSIPIFTNDRVVGHFDNGVYRTIRTRSKHYYRKEKGYPISDSVLRELEGLQCHSIVIIEKSSEGEREYWFDFARYNTAIPFQHRGYDVQRCVGLHMAEGSLEW